MLLRQVVLDTETTGLEPSEGHRIIEIGCVELVSRRITGQTFHCYLNPDRAIDQGAQKVHGITQADLADKPRFGDIVEELLRFLNGSEVIIHNAPFDVGFIEHELKLWKADAASLADYCRVIDTLVMARSLHPGQRNSLDALCKRYQVDNSQREWHGALLDAELLARVYLAMTGGQGSLFDAGLSTLETVVQKTVATKQVVKQQPLRIIQPTSEEMIAHEQCLAGIAKQSGKKVLWEEEVSTCNYSRLTVITASKPG